MENDKLTELLAYLDGLTKLASTEAYICNKEIAECIGWIRLSTDARYPTNLLEFSNAKQSGKVHPTQKPVALFEYLIRTYTNEGDVILDNCIGSGTTGVAAINTNRNFIGIEQDADYVAIAQRRIDEAQAEQVGGL